MKSDDPEGIFLTSCIAQQEVAALYSGALISTIDEIRIEGVKGFGDEFMMGKSAPIDLPENVVSDVKALYKDMETALGPIRLEWAHDGYQVWVLQLHTGISEGSKRIIYPGEFNKKLDFHVSTGLESLRKLIQKIGPDEGVLVHGNIGMSSHIADLLRKAKIPSCLA
jgi:hypothetical protein